MWVLRPSQARSVSAPSPAPSLPLQARTCVFDVTTAPGDLFLVVKLEKVLQGDLGEAIEPYIKEERNVEKVLCL